MGEGGLRHALSLYPGKSPVPIIQDARLAPGPVCSKISSSPEFDRWIVQPVASRYTDFYPEPLYPGWVLLYLRTNTESVLRYDMSSGC